MLKKLMHYKSELKKYKEWNKNNTDKSHEQTIICLEKLIDKLEDIDLPKELQYINLGNWIKENASQELRNKIRREKIEDKISETYENALMSMQFKQIDAIFYWYEVQQNWFKVLKEYDKIIETK